MIFGVGLAIAGECKHSRTPLKAARRPALRPIPMTDATERRGVTCALAGERIENRHADVIELKTGQRVEGTLKQATPASVAVEVGGQTITFEGDKVRAMSFGSMPPPKSGVPSLRGEAMRALRGQSRLSTPRDRCQNPHRPNRVDEDKADPPPVR